MLNQIPRGSNHSIRKAQHRRKHKKRPACKAQNATKKAKATHRDAGRCKKGKGARPRAELEQYPESDGDPSAQLKDCELQRISEDEAPRAIADDEAHEPVLATIADRAAYCAAGFP